MLMLMGRSFLSGLCENTHCVTGLDRPTLCKQQPTLARTVAIAAGAACWGSRYFELHGRSVGRTPMRVHHTKKEMFP